MENTEQWKANEKALEALINMGIPKRAAEIALYYTGNESPDAAVAFYFDNPEIEATAVQFERGVTTEGQDRVADDESSDDEVDLVSCKMVFVVNTSLGMGIGKIAAQVAHAALGLYRNMLTDQRVARELSLWQEYGEKKIVVKGNDAEHLQSLQKAALEKNVHCCLIQDAGHTQIPSGSVTVLGLFGEENRVNEISGQLGLL